MDVVIGIPFTVHELVCVCQW